jgi:hypothetical protein
MAAGTEMRGYVQITKTFLKKRRSVGSRCLKDLAKNGIIN